MAREASDLTKAIRALCDETNGTITHGQARPRLKDMGFEIVDDPGEKSDDLKAFEKAVAGYEKVNPEDAAAVKALHEAVRVELDWSTPRLRKVEKEIAGRKAFHDERNNFDVTKYNWKQQRPTPSVKPADSPNTKAKVAAKHGRTVTTVVKAPVPAHPSSNGKPRPKHAPAQAAADAYASGLEALRQVKAMGGIAAVQKKLEAGKQQHADLVAQAETVAEGNGKLEALLEQVATLEKELQSAA